MSLSGNPVAYRALGGRTSNQKVASACASSAAEARVPLWEDLAAVGGTVGGGLRRARQALPFANGSFQVVSSPALKFHGHQQLLEKEEKKNQNTIDCTLSDENVRQEDALVSIPPFDSFF